MTRLSYDDYLRHLDADSARLRAVLADCDPAARVPGCPDWTAADLLGHHAGVLHFWAGVIERRPTPPHEDDEDVDTPPAYEELLAFHQTQADRLVAALRAADPTEEAWSWSAEQTVGFAFRRQAHEALIHRLDAEQTAGTVTPLDSHLAADGVDEALDVMLGGTPEWGLFTGSGRHVRVEVTDTGDAIWVELGRFTGTDPTSQETHDLDDISVVVDPGTAPDLVVAGPAGTLDAWLWHRADDRDITVTGAPDVRELFRACVDQPIS